MGQFRYTIKKDGVVRNCTNCVHVAKSLAERIGGQLWRNLPDRSYMVTDYAVPTEREKQDGQEESTSWA